MLSASPSTTRPVTSEFVMTDEASTRGVNAGGMPGHFGLLGMRERAAKASRRAKNLQQVGAGTEIDLRVPANVAYKRWALPDLPAWLRSRGISA